MTISFDKILSSRTFQFLVGPDCPERKPFTIHTAVVEDHSAPLAVLMNGLMREATDGIAILDDIDEQTFVRFCEYAYMGDYTPAQRQLVLAASKVNRAELPAPVKDYSDDFFGFPSSKKEKKEKKKSASVFSGFDSVEKSCGQCGREAPMQILWDEFQRRDYSVVSPKFRPRENLEECEDNAGPFLCHARVYVFADRYDIAGLRILALDKLHQALCSFKAAGNQMGKVIDLPQFCYSNDNTRDNEAGQDIDRLRSMVVHFVVCVFEIIVKDNSFLELMEEGGRFARDLTGLLGKRITGNAS